MGSKSMLIESPFDYCKIEEKIRVGLVCLVGSCNTVAYKLLGACLGLVEGATSKARRKPQGHIGAKG